MSDEPSLPERLRAIGDDIFNGRFLDEGHIEDLKNAAGQLEHGSDGVLTVEIAHDHRHLDRVMSSLLESTLDVTFHWPNGHWPPTTVRGTLTAADGWWLYVEHADSIPLSLVVIDKITVIANPDTPKEVNPS